MIPLRELGRRLQLEIIEQARTRKNWHENRIEMDGDPLEYAVGAIARLPRPKSQADITRAADAMVHLSAWARNHEWTLRAVGSSWSFSDAMAPGRRLRDTKCILVETGAFKSLIPTSRPDLFYVSSGSNVHNLNVALEARGRSVPTSGSSDGQTIAGAIGTGVHGSAFAIGAIHDGVRGIHLATPRGHLLIARSDEALPKAVRSEVGQMFDIRRVVVDASLFDAASVSFGSFGVLVGVVLETRAHPSLRVLRRSIPSARLDALLETIRHGGDFGALNVNLDAERSDDVAHHCQLLVNPYDDRTYKVVLMYEREGFVPDEPFSWPDEFGQFGVCILDLLGGFIGHFDALYDDLVGDQFDGIEDVDKWGRRSEIFGAPNQPLPVHSVGIGVPIDETRRVLALVHDTAEEERIPGACEIRFVKASPATLAINRFDPITAVLGFDALDHDDAWEFSRLLYARLRSAGVQFSFHWGKMTDLGSDPTDNLIKLEDQYGPAIQAWKQARKDLLGTDMEVFDNAFVRRLGLAETP